jgi:hypothetical protein
LLFLVPEVCAMTGGRANPVTSQQTLAIFVKRISSGFKGNSRSTFAFTLSFVFYVMICETCREA